MASSSLQIKLNEKALNAARAAFEAGRGRELAKAVLDLFGELAPAVATKISTTVRNGGSSGLRIRSGALARAILGKAGLDRERNRDPAITIGVFAGSTALAYAGVHEYGTKGKDPSSPIATIKPKRAKHLWVPWGNQTLTPAGVSKFNSPRDYPGNLIIIPTKNKTGNVAAVAYDEETLELAVENELTLRQTEAAYLLLRELDLPGRHYLRDGFAAALPIIEQRLSDMIVRLFSE